MTYAPPPGPSILPPALLSKMLSMSETDEAFMGSGGSTTSTPTTPAYPAYSKNLTVPVTPRAQGPLAMWGAALVLSATVELLHSGVPTRSSPVPSPLTLMPSLSVLPQNECIIVCHHRCSEPLDCNNCCAKSSVIEMRIDGALPPRQEVEDKGNELLERQETLLAVYRASRGLLI